MDGRTAVATVALSAAGLSLALRQARLHLPSQRGPLMGLAAAFVFSAQMLNLPVVGGASAHLVGSVLTAVLLGMLNSCAPGLAVVNIDNDNGAAQLRST